MKTLKLITVLIGMLFINQSFAQDLIKLPEPNKTGGKPLMQVLNERQSSRDFIDKELSMQQISDLLWAANGINRPAENKRTAPTAMNSQDVDIYVVMKEGSYLYDAKNHKLILVDAADNRAMVAGTQKNFANAPLFCVMVSDISRFTRGDESQKMPWAAMDAAMVSQNINLFCAGVGLKTRPRVFMEVDNLRKALKLSATQHPMLNNPVGK